MNENITDFKVQLNFVSFLKLSALIGFCFGAGSIPIIIIINLGTAGVMVIPIAIIASPIVGLVNGTLAGLLGYPAYTWISKKIGFTYSGSLFTSE